MVSKVFTMKAAAAALVAVLSIGGIAAAATGLLPDQASPVADKAAATTADAAGHGLGKAAVANTGGTAPAGSTDGQGRESAVGPDASGAARAGLCRAWQAGQGGDHGRRMDSVAFQALVTPPAGPTRSPPTARTSPPAQALRTHGKGQGRRRASRPLRPPSRHRAAGHRRIRARPRARAPEGTGRADPDHHRLTHPVVVAADRPSTGRPPSQQREAWMVEHPDIHPPPDDQSAVDKLLARRTPQ